MIRVKKIVYLFAAGLLLAGGTGCKKYLDVNKNLNDPTKVSVSLLLTGAERQIGYSINGLSSTLSVYTHQRTSRGGADGYGIKGSDVGWDGFYDALVDLDVIIEQAPGELRFFYAGIAKILKAYTYSQMVDTWGALPFSEFNKFKQGITQPKFDEDEVIYPQLITMIDAGIADINNATPNASVPGADDLIYAGNKARWIKAANTIKLKLYTQLRRIQNVTPQVTALLATPANLIAATNEGMYLPFGITSNDRNPGFGDYAASQRGQNPSPWLYEIMKGIDHNGGTNPSVFPGVVDPRIPYYIYNQLPVTGAPVPANMTEYRDGPFVTIYFGSRGPNRDGAQQNSYSMFGIYPVGGKYDDGLGGNATASFGTGAAPQKFLTYADRLYLEAELINTGVIAGDAKAVLTAAMNASMAQVDYVITTFVKPSQTVPALGTQTAYVNAILALYDAGTTAKKLEIIMTQKWLSSLWSSVDQYTDYRRTGYPVLFDPSNPVHAPGGRVQPPVNGNPLLPGGQPSVPVQVSVAYPESLPWPQTEKELNANAPTQKTPATYKIFWKP